MKKSLTAALAAMLALVSVLSGLPVSALPGAEKAVSEVVVPEGYNAHDYDKCVWFLEQTDENGVKNGTKLNADYDPNDPATWGSYHTFQWVNADGEKRLFSINTGWLNGGDDSPCGELDLSGCTALEKVYIQKFYSDEPKIRINSVDVTGCTALRELWIRNASLTELDVSTNTALTHLLCGGNMLNELDVSNNPELVMLGCWMNMLTELDISNNLALMELYCDQNELTAVDISQHTALECFQCSYNRISELDISGNPDLRNLCCQYNLITELDLEGRLFPIPTVIRAEGSGTIGFANSDDSISLGRFYAVPDEDAEFIGFEYYTGSGERLEDIITSDLPFEEPCHDEDTGLWTLDSQGYYYWYYFWNVEGLSPDDLGGITIIARFSEEEPIPGDADGNGIVDTTDALLVLRCALGISGNPAEMLAACDMDGNGLIDTTDALLILRTALGIV